MKPTDSGTKVVSDVELWVSELPSYLINLMSDENFKSATNNDIITFEEYGQRQNRN